MVKSVRMAEHGLVRLTALLSRWRWLWVLALVAMTPFFFIGGMDSAAQAQPRPATHPLLEAGWNLGHPVYFGLLTLVWLRHWPAPAWRRWVVITLTVLVVGILVETVQHQIGRFFSWGDVRANLVGAWCVLAFWPGNLPLHRRLRLGVRLLALVLLLLEISQLGRAGLEEWRLQRQLPVLNDQTSTVQQAYWAGPVRPEPAVPGEAGPSLRVDLGTARYSGIALNRLPQDWSDYSALTFRILNPDSDRLPLTLRINDRAHDRGNQAYDNRFNTRLWAEPGWNRYHIALDEVAAAPAERTMDMDQIARLIIFATDLPAPRLIYLDDLRLE